MNPFEALAESSKPAFQRRREAAAQKRKTAVPDVPTPLERALQERDNLSKAYRAARRKREAELLEGPVGAELGRLISFMRTMTPSSAPALIKLVEQAEWLRNAPKSIRLDILGIIGRAIIRLREREGLEPFDDAIFGEPPDAFTRINTLIGEQA